jgi:hypothetical protein
MVTVTHALLCCTVSHVMTGISQECCEQQLQVQHMVETRGHHASQVCGKPIASNSGTNSRRHWLLNEPLMVLASGAVTGVHHNMTVLKPECTT